MKPEFQSFRKIPRYDREIVVTEKIDGTNGLVYIEPLSEGNDNRPPIYAWHDGEKIMGMWAGSRNRWITPQDDNYGFAAWVQQNAEEMRNLGPGYHYGEWWGMGIQRKYGLQERRFSLFNVKRWNDDNPPPKCCHVVPVLWRGKMSDFSFFDTWHMLDSWGSYAAPGFKNPEGIIIYHVASGQYFKYTLDNDGHKG